MDRYASLRRGLVGAWCPSLGATGYTLLDRSGRGNHGTLTNMAGQNNWRASGSGIALALDGVNDVVVMPRGSPVTTNRITVAAWHCPQETARGDILTSWGNGGDASQFDLLQGLTASKWRFYISDGAARGTSDSTTTFTLGNWYHVCGTYDGATLALYVNGVLETSSALTATMQTASLPVIRIGNNNPGDGLLQALVDDLRLYDRALSPSEIRLLASQRGIGLCPTRHRRGSLASTATTMSINVGGTWKSATPWVNVAGVWKQATPSIKIAGVWK